MENKRIEDKIDKIVEDVGEIKTHMAVYNAQLTLHIKRTEMLEEKLEPVEKHVAMVSGAIKLVGVVAMIVAIIEGLLKII